MVQIAQRSDILTGVNKLFAGDCLAIKEGKMCLIEITCSVSHEIHLHKEFCKYTGFDLYVIFAKRDMSKIILKKIDLNDNRRTSTVLVSDIRNYKPPNPAQVYGEDLK